MVNSDTREDLSTYDYASLRSPEWLRHPRMNDDQLTSLDLMGEARDWQASQKDNREEHEHFCSRQLGPPMEVKPG
jgi:hypothetical protein